MVQERVKWPKSVKLGRQNVGVMLSFLTSQILKSLTVKHSNTKQIQYKTQGGGGSVGIWGCMTAQGTGVNMIYDCRLNQYRYKEILDECLKPSVDFFFAGQPSTQPNLDWYFQHDNAPCHTAGSIREYLSVEKIMMLPWPAILTSLIFQTHILLFFGTRSQSRQDPKFFLR
jgi:hypothetical protein